MTAPGSPGSEEWLVVLRADGIVDAALGGAPGNWIGRPLTEAPGIPEVLERSAAELLKERPTSMVRRRKVTHCESGRTVLVELLVVEALPLRRAATNLHELVMRTMDLFLSQANSNDIDFSVDLAEGVPPLVFVDSEKIAWAISMLVANALRFANKRVAVHVRSDPLSKNLLIEVRDDGAGIPEGQVRWLFERNPRTGQAAGLALVMVSDVVTAHRGSVMVRTQPGHGSAFTMRIPPFPDA